MLSNLEEWISENDSAISRPEAVRRLVELGLKASNQMAEQLNEAKSHAAQAAKLAAELGLKVKN